MLPSNWLDIIARKGHSTIPHIDELLFTYNQPISYHNIACSFLLAFKHRG